MDRREEYIYIRRENQAFHMWWNEAYLHLKKSYRNIDNEERGEETNVISILNRREQFTDKFCKKKLFMNDQINFFSTK